MPTTKSPTKDDPAMGSQVAKLKADLEEFEKAIAGREGSLTQNMQVEHVSQLTTHERCG